MTEQSEEARKRKEERLKRDTEKFKANLQVSRPGFGGDYSSRTGAKIEPQESLEAGKERLELSGILWLSPEQLQENPYNDYPPLSGEELMELAKDIAEKGVLVPLIVRVSEDVLICGHNRRRASIEAKEPKVPVQRVLRLLSEEEERDIMKSENDRRRGGNWSKEKKEEFIREHFGEQLESVTHGGIRGNQYTGGQSSLNLASEIEKKSRGKITEGTAKRIVSGMRKEKPAVSKSSPKKSSLSEKDKKRGEKLALHLKTLKQTREKLEEKLNNVKTEEKRVLKELKSIGQPELFGVEL